MGLKEVVIKECAKLMKDGEIIEVVEVSPHIVAVHTNTPGHVKPVTGWNIFYDPRSAYVNPGVSSNQFLLGDRMVGKVPFMDAPFDPSLSRNLPTTYALNNMGPQQSIYDKPIISHPMKEIPKYM